MKTETSTEQLREALLRGEYDAVLRRHPVRSGESMYVPGGTLNSFGPGVLVYKVEEPAPPPIHAMPWNVRDGAAVPLEEQRAKIEALLATLDLEQRPRLTPGLSITVDDGADRIFCHAGPRFVLERVRVLAGASLRRPLHGALIITNVAPPVRVRAGVEEELLARGNTLLLPAALEAIELRGPADVFLAYIPDLERDVRAPLAKAGYSPELIASLGEA